MAHLGAIEQQDGHLNAVAALDLGVGVDIHDVHGRKGQRAAQFLQIRDHLVTQTAAIAVHDRKTGSHLQWCAGPVSDTPCCFTEFAKNRTVAGGTSPTAVTLCPSTNVENAEEVPTVAVSSSVPGCEPVT